MNNFDIFLLLVWIGLPILFYFFAFKNHDEKKADLIVFIVCTYIVINYLASNVTQWRLVIDDPILLISFPIFQIPILVFLGLKFYSIDIFNKFNGKLALIIFVTLLLISQLIFFVGNLSTIGILAEYFGIIRSLLRIISAFSFISFLVLYLILMNERKFMLFSKASDTVKNNLSVGDEKSKYSKDHPSNW